MKKIIIINLVIIVLSALCIKILMLNIPDNKVMIKVNDISQLSDINAILYNKAFSIEENYLFNVYKDENINNYSNCEITALVVRSTGEVDLYNRLSKQKVIVEDVLSDNNQNLIGSEIELLSHNYVANSFSYEKKEEFDSRIERCTSINHYQLAHHDFICRGFYYDSYQNIMKKNHHYLALCNVFHTDKGDYIYLNSTISYFDLDNDYSKPVKEKDGYYGNYCNYIDNEIFCDSEEALNEYLKFKNYIFKKYGLIDSEY